MSVTMTVGDMVLNLGLGLLAIALWAVAPRIRSAVDFWWAERSQRARERKLATLEAELASYRKILSDPTRYLAEVIGIATMVVLWTMLTGTVLMASISNEVVSIRRVVDPIDPSLYLWSSFHVAKTTQQMMEQGLRAIFVVASVFLLVRAVSLVQAVLLHSLRRVHCQTDNR